MILIPEIETVLLLVPRTGTRSLKYAVAERYPRSMLLYRHMEADGVPQGYDRWRKIGVVRHPIDRMWSLYKYLQRFGIDYANEHRSVYTTSMRESVNMPFEEWLLTNQTVFTSPYDSETTARFWPEYTCRHPLPENRKSQFVYLRPDLGTRIVRYKNIAGLHKLLDVLPGRHNRTEERDHPPLSEEGMTHIHRWFDWDMENC